MAGAGLDVSRREGVSPDVVLGVRAVKPASAAEPEANGLATGGGVLQQWSTDDSAAVGHAIEKLFELLLEIERAASP